MANAIFSTAKFSSQHHDHEQISCYVAMIFSNFVFAWRKTVQLPFCSFVSRAENALRTGRDLATLEF